MAKPDSRIFNNDCAVDGDDKCVVSDDWCVNINFQIVVSSYLHCVNQHFWVHVLGGSTIQIVLSKQVYTFRVQVHIQIQTSLSP